MPTDLAKSTLAGDLRELAEQIIVRVKTGDTNLAKVEELMLNLVLSETSPLRNDPGFLLAVCKYLRNSVNTETQMVLELAIAASGKARLPLDQEDKPTFGVTANPNSALAGYTAEERERLREQLETS